MKAGLFSLLLLFTFAILSSSVVHGACKSGESDPYGPHPSPSKRIYEYNSPDKSKDTSPKGGNVLHVLGFNIQSGLSSNPQCKFNLATQAEVAKNTHVFGMQEVDVNNDLRCNCAQPQVIANISGHDTRFLNTILYRTGLYGHLVGSTAAIEETRQMMYKSFSGEQRGLIAIRTKPAQLGGRTLWTIETHLQFGNEFVRLGQVDELIAFTQGLVSSYPQALFMAIGDMYTVPGTGSYNRMASYFLNAWTVYHGSAEGGFTYPAANPDSRFEHVWFKFPSGTQYSVRCDIPALLISDHRPLHVYFTFTGSSTSGSSTSGSSNSGTSTSTTGSTSSPTVKPTQPPSNGCSAVVSVRVKQGPWQTANGWSTEYEVVATNNGKCPITSITLNFGSAAFANYWQMTKNGANYDMKIYGDMMNGGTASAGFILNHASSTAPTVNPTVTTKCSSSCGGTTPTQGPGQTCTAANNGKLRCVAPGTSAQFQICDNGKWTSGQMCASPLVCKTSGDTAYCDYK